MILLQTEFSSFELTPEEFEIGRQFNPEQRAVIQNVLSDYASEYMSLTVDIENNTVEAANKRSYNKGAIAALKYLLELSSLQPQETEIKE